MKHLVQPDAYFAYDDLTPTLFHNEWWLDIVSRGQWQASRCLVDGELVGWMPYFPQKRLVFGQSRMPTLTHFLGPAIKLGEGSDVTRLIRSLHVTRSLIKGVPPLSCFTQKMHHGIKDVVAFQMEGFHTSVQFTFEIAPSPAEDLWRAMRDKTRNNIRSAQKKMQIEVNIASSDFADAFQANIQDRNDRISFDRSILIDLIEACLTRNCGRIYAATEGSGLDAAIFCAWDCRYCYYLVSTRRLASSSGAVSLCLWEAIRDAARRGLIFDFDGLATSGAVKFYAGFGARIEPRYTVSRLTNAFHIMRNARRILKAEDNFFTDNN